MFDTLDFGRHACSCYFLSESILFVLLQMYNVSHLVGSVLRDSVQLESDKVLSDPEILLGKKGSIQL